MNTRKLALFWLGLVLGLVAIWPLSAALDAVAARDYLGGALLLGLTWVVARSGVELATAQDDASGGARDG